MSIRMCVFGFVHVHAITPYYDCSHELRSSHLLYVSDHDSRFHNPAFANQISTRVDRRNKKNLPAGGARHRGCPSFSCVQYLLKLHLHHALWRFHPPQRKECQKVDMANLVVVTR
jgi:hypothetical protein